MSKYGTNTDRNSYRGEGLYTVRERRGRRRRKKEDKGKEKEMEKRKIIKE